MSTAQKRKNQIGIRSHFNPHNRKIDRPVPYDEYCDDELSEPESLRNILESYEYTIHDIVCDPYDEFSIPSENIFNFVNEQEKNFLN
jgi:hypothetical protein